MTTSYPTIIIIGAGNMGASLIGGLIKHGHPKDKIYATDPDQSKIDSIQQQFGINVTQDNQAAMLHADVVILAIKPQVFAEVLIPLVQVVQAKKPLIVSIAAGVQVATIDRLLGGNLAIIRAMPNTPALIGLGATGLYANQTTTDAQCKTGESILNAVGITIWVSSEPLIDTVTALSGSGPAYFFLIMESLQNAAVELGLSPSDAYTLTLQTALGAAQMACTSQSSLAQLRKNVTSPGGTTEKAISILEQNQIRELFLNALKGAKSRSEELAKDKL
jgi:pyrroline-5-carboxylate reductase